MIPRKFKKICVSCGETDLRITKEHFWPIWLIERTGTYRNSVRLDEKKRINPKSLVVPLCFRCNRDFGRELESPVAHVFRNLEAGVGLSDVDAELLIRWLWKFEELFWRFTHADSSTRKHYEIRDRVLSPIVDQRLDLCLAISIVAKIKPGFADSPMGLDSWSECNPIFVAGVFSKIALMVLDSRFLGDVPKQFSCYQLAKLDAPDRDAKLFYSKVGFRDFVEAVNVTRECANYLSYAHDLAARNSQRM